MKRVFFATVATIAGVVALLSFKTHSHPLAVPDGLPSVSAPSPVPSTSTSRSGVTTSAPPRPKNSAASSSSAAAAQRTVSGSPVQTQYGVVQVAVVVTGSHIDSVRFIRLDAFDGRSREINSFAAPILLRETMSAQRAHIDTVSGATFTSEGYVESLQSALDEAGLK